MFTPGITQGGVGAIAGRWLSAAAVPVLAAPLQLAARREVCGRRDFTQNDSLGAGFYKQPPPAFAIGSVIVQAA